MYEYLDRSPQVGDVVEFIDNSGYTQNKLGSLHQVTQIMENGKLSGLVPQLKGVTTPFPDRFKVVKTKPGNTARTGDTIIRIANGAYPTGTIHTVYRNFGEGLDKNSVYCTDSASIPHTDVLVLCKAQQKEQPMQITDYIVDIANSTLADRLVLRQVLLDNGQKVDSDMHTTGSNIYYMCTTWYCGNHISGYNISLADFINKFKKQDKLRNLAFYKRSGEPWTDHEFTNMYDFIGGTTGRGTLRGNSENKYFYDDGTMTPYNAWPMQDKPNFKNCLQVAYEDVFPTTNQKSETTQVESTNQPTKEQPMNKLDLRLLTAIMAALATAEDEQLDATNSEFICVLTKDNNYEGYFYSNSVGDYTEVMQKVENAEKKLHVFKYQSTVAQKPRKIIEVERS